MSGIREEKHNYLYYKYTQIHIVAGLYFFGKCTSCNPSQALEHSEERKYNHDYTQFCTVSENLVIFTRNKWQEG